MNQLSIDKNYQQFLKTTKKQLKKAQIRASLSVSRELIQFYWELGQSIIEKQKATNWGSKFLEQLSQDLRNTFPSMQAFSKRNLERMRQFAGLYSEAQIAAQAVPQLPWSHIVLLIQRVKDAPMLRMI